MTRADGRHGAIPAWERLGLSRSQAAQYIGYSTRDFDAMVRLGLMPPARKFSGRRTWHRWEIEKAYNDLPEDDDSATLSLSPYSDVA